MKRLLTPVAAGLACAACAGDPHGPASQPSATPPGCIAAGGGYLQAQLRGAENHDIDWTNTTMQCEGGPRPDANGLRLTFAGPLPGEPGRQVRFIFGVDMQDTAAGSAQALPTNITIILEGEQRIFATRGDDRCAIETLERTPLAASGMQQRVHARGYCTGPALDLAGGASLLVPTFEFTGVIATGADP